VIRWIWCVILHSTVLLIIPCTWISSKAKMDMNKVDLLKLKQSLQERYMWSCPSAHHEGIWGEWRYSHTCKSSLNSSLSVKHYMTYQVRIMDSIQAMLQQLSIWATHTVIPKHISFLHDQKLLVGNPLTIKKQFKTSNINTISIIDATNTPN